MDKEASVNFSGNNSAQFDCKISDISLRGARICVREKLPKPAKLILNINNPAGIDNFDATIIWEQEAKAFVGKGHFLQNLLRRKEKEGNGPMKKKVEINAINDKIERR